MVGTKVPRATRTFESRKRLGRGLTNEGKALIDAHDRGTAAWWERLLAFAASAAVEALVEGHDDLVRRVARMVRPIASLTIAQAGHRDLRQVESQLRRLTERYAELRGAADTGHRVAVERPAPH